MKSGKLVNILPKGLETNNGSKGPFIQNMHRRLDGWEVRPGFGQLAQFDSTLSAQIPGVDSGYKRQLGSYALTTSWGAVQIVTVLVGFGNTSNISDYGSSIHYYALNVYDVDTGRRWEEILHEHAGDNANAATPMPLWSGNYQTAVNSNRKTFLSADETADKLFFCKANNDTLLFGSEKVGFWAYVPADFDIAVSRQTDALHLAVDCIPYAESSKVVRVASGNGIYDGITYLDSATFPSFPTAVVLVENRYAIAKGRSVYLSDVGRPGSVASLNIVDVPLREDIVALGEFAGVLLIFSSNETFAYRMSAGPNVSSGDLRRLSSDVGCLGSQAVTKADTGLVWCDKSGVYLFRGGSNFQPMAEGLKDLFEPGGSLSLPLTSYWTDSASPTSAYAQPRSFIHWGDEQTHVSYEQELGMLFVTMPSQSASLVMSRGAWSLFSYESIVDKEGLIRSSTTIVQPYIAVVSGSVFAVCGPEIENEVGSIIILEMGRGGALDRTAMPSDDMRGFGGEYDTGPASENMFALGKPTVHPDSFLLPDSAPPHAGKVFLFPVSVRPSIINPSTMTFEFSFDKTKWSPVFSSITGQVAAMFPAERLVSMYAWGVGSPTALSEIRCYQGALVDEAGDTIKAKFEGGRAAIQTWSEKPNMLLSKERFNPIVWLPFVRTGGTPTMSLGVAAASGTLNANPHDFLWWKAPSVADYRKFENEDVTPVDWVLKSDQMEAGEGEQIRVRGLRLSVLSRGESTEKIIAGLWPSGMMNVSFQSDWRDWSGQIRDAAKYMLRYGKDPTRSRFVPTGSDSYKKRVFDGVASWSSPGLTDGDFLVDDEQRDRVSMSLSMRGERVSAMLFGHIRAVSARVVVTSMNAGVRVVGAARRRGR